jgi:oligosaccharide repeat unit polymerase
MSLRSSSPTPFVIAAQVVVALLIGPLLWTAGQSSVEFGIACASWATLLLLAWSVASWWVLRETLFEPYPAFLLAAFLFNAGHALLEVFGANARGFLFDRFDHADIQATLLLVLVSLAWLHLGALIAVSRPTRGARLDAVRPWSGSSARIVGAALLAISIWPAFDTLRLTLTRSLAGGYLSTYQQDFATGFDAGADVLAALVVPAALFLLAGTSRLRLARLIPVVVIGLVVAANLAIGARITAVMSLFGLVWQWHHTVRRIRLQWLVTGALILMFVIFPVVRSVRDGTGSGRYSVDALAESFSAIQNPAVEILSEMGFSMATVAYTLELVPERRPFDSGVSYGYAALAVVPNAFWSIHPMVAHGLAADWLIWEVDQSNAARQAGLGYSFIAEAYLNFGWLGTPFVMLLIGYGTVALTRWATEPTDPAKFAAVAAFMTFFLRFPRGESGSVIRPLIWYALAPYLAVRLVEYLGSEARVPARGRTAAPAIRQPVAFEAEGV